MAFLDHESSAEYPYPSDVVFDALVAAIPQIAGMNIHTTDKLSGRIVLKTGVSVMSWGENVSIVVSESVGGRTRLSVTSTPKTGALFGGAFDLGKNRKNIERLLSSLSDALRATPPTPPLIAAPRSHADPAERMAKLKILAEKGLITKSEFEKRKLEILNDI